jgi:hypothetical protein
MAIATGGMLPSAEKSRAFQFLAQPRGRCSATTGIFVRIRGEPQPTLSVGKYDELAFWLGDEFRFPHDLDGSCSIFVACHPHTSLCSD